MLPILKNTCAVLFVIKSAGPVHTVFTVTEISMTTCRLKCTFTMQVRVTDLCSLKVLLIDAIGVGTKKLKEDNLLE